MDRHASRIAVALVFIGCMMVTLGRATAKDLPLKSEVTSAALEARSQWAAIQKRIDAAVRKARPAVVRIGCGETGRQGCCGGVIVTADGYVITREKEVREFSPEPSPRIGRISLSAAPWWLMTSCRLDSGDWGGGLFDLDGRLIGINIPKGIETACHPAIELFQKQWDDLVAGKNLEIPPPVISSESNGSPADKAKSTHPPWVATSKKHWSR
jgi:hypothetical protein